MKPREEVTEPHKSQKSFRIQLLFLNMTVAAECEKLDSESVY